MKLARVLLATLCLASLNGCFSIHMYEGSRQSRKKLAHLDIDDDWIRPIAIDATDAGLRKGFYLLPGEHVLDIELMRVVQGSQEKHELRKLGIASQDTSEYA